MKVRLVDLDNDYLEISSWYEGHGWAKAPEKELLPKSGFVIEEGKRMMATGFLYMTNSPIAWVEWTATNPKEAHLTRIRALKTLMNHIKAAAEQSGYPRLMQIIPDKKLVRFYEKHLDFKRAEDGSILFWGKEI